MLLWYTNIQLINLLSNPTSAWKISLASLTILISLSYSIWCFMCVRILPQSLSLSLLALEFNHSILKIIRSLEYCILDRRQCYTCGAINYTHIKLFMGIGGGGWWCCCSQYKLDNKRQSNCDEGRGRALRTAIYPDFNMLCHAIICRKWNWMSYKYSNLRVYHLWSECVSVCVCVFLFIKIIRS